MSTTTHTPEPWVCIRGGEGECTRIVAGYLEIAVLNLQRKSVVANGRLIAAAPDLLTELVAAPDLPDDWPGHDAVEAFEAAYLAWLASRSAAIAKAEAQ